MARKFPAVASVPVNSTGLGGAIISNSFVYVVGGVNEDGVLPLMEVYSALSGNWTMGAPIPSPLAATAIGVLPQPARCQPTDGGGGCNVCGACCQTFVPDGPGCDLCVSMQCSRRPAFLVTAGGIETGQKGDGPPVTAVFAFDVVGAAWNNGTSPAAALPPLATARAYHGVGVVQNASGYATGDAGYEMVFTAGSSLGDCTKNTGALASVEVYGVAPRGEQVSG